LRIGPAGLAPEVHLAPQAAVDATDDIRFLARLDEADHRLLRAGTRAQVEVGGGGADGLRLSCAQQRKGKGGGGEDAFHDVSPSLSIIFSIGISGPTTGASRIGSITESFPAVQRP
jgi:hypothetical protein